MALKIKLLFGCILLFGLNSFAQQLTAEEKKVFDDITYIIGRNGKPVIMKWVSPIRYEITGEKADYLVKDAEAIFSKLAELTSLDIKKATDDDEANFIIDLGKDDPSRDFGYYLRYMGNSMPKPNEKYEIIEARMNFVVSIALSKVDRRYVFIRMILKSMGFLKKSYELENSLFYSRENNTLKIEKSDAKIIQLLYAKEIKPGMTKDEVNHLLGVN
jgi:hypothetical protein